MLTLFKIFSLSLCFATVGVCVTGCNNSKVPEVTFTPVDTYTIAVSKIFSDDIVLQQKLPVRIWGTGINNKATVTVTVGDRSSIGIIKDGKWEVILDPFDGGYTEYTMIITSNDSTKEISINNILFGEVWLCAGQSNMNVALSGVTGGASEINKASNTSLRMYRCSMPEGLLEADNPENKYNSEWLSFDKSLVSNEKLNMFSAAAFFYAKYIQENINMPVGVIVMSCGNTLNESFISKESLSANNEIKSFANINSGLLNHRSSLFYDSMSQQIIPYTIKGVLWYQGESNGVNSAESFNKYQTLLQTLINSWRTTWVNQDMPFVIVQLPKYPTKPAPFGTKEHWESIKSAQKAVSDNSKNVWLVKTDDIDNDVDVHPAHKKVLGKRAADVALNNVYK